MSARNFAWYALNSARAYPLDEAATMVDDDGKLLPNDVLVDCRVAFPHTAAAYAYLGALSVTPGAVTLIIMGSDVPARAGGCTPPTDSGTRRVLASVSLPKATLEPGRHYPLAAIYPGVGGWVVFGDGVLNRRPDSDTFYSGRFGTVAQSMLAPKAARSYRAAPVTGVSALGAAAALTGLVRFIAGSDLEIVREMRHLEGREREAIVFRLKSNTPVGNGRNVFDLFKGECNRRPESGNCEGDPIEQLAGAIPDCCGVLTLNFVGCAAITPTVDGHGIVIDCGVGLIDACFGPDPLPDADGRLPNEREGNC